MFFRIHRFVALKIMQIIYYAKYYYRLNEHALITKIKHRISCILLPSNHAVTRAFRVYEWWYRLPNRKKTVRVGTTSTYYFLDQNIWQRNWFEDVEKLEFEDTTIDVPTKYDELLTQLFGDYRIPVHSPRSHGDIYFDLEHNYTDYYDGTRTFRKDDLNF